MKKITLSNGIEITAFVGDGFDGGSGIFVRKQGFHFKHEDVPIPQQDRKAVKAFLKWYVKEEMKLREYEGTLRYVVKGDLRKIPSNIESTYQAIYWAGTL